MKSPKKIDKNLAINRLRLANTHTSIHGSQTKTRLTLKEYDQEIFHEKLDLKSVH